jgi:glycosyltransferase involved in cell wall biosynthesis
MKSLSIVIPVYNEKENIADLHREITAVCTRNQYPFEIIIVDDGSSDGTVEEIKTLTPVRYIRFRKNFGQTAAMDAGIKNAKNDYIITIDGDRQNDPEDIPMMISYLENNDLDVVVGWRKSRKDGFLKKFVSRGANFLRKLLINDEIHDSGCSLKVYKKECFENVTLYGEMHRFIPALLKIKGFAIGEIVVNHRPRVAGKTKYNWRRTFKGFIDIISVWFWRKYAVRPLHLLGGAGLLSFLLGVLSGFYSLYYYFTTGKVGNTAWPIFSAFLLITGITLFFLGLLADILMKSYYESTKDRPYHIKEVIEND